MDCDVRGFTDTLCDDVKVPFLTVIIRTFDIYRWVDVVKILYKTQTDMYRVKIS